MSQVETASTAYQRRVVQYLTSPLGKSTSDAIAGRLLALIPASIDMPEEPSIPELHSLRAYLDAWHVDVENDQDMSGVHAIPSLRF